LPGVVLSAKDEERLRERAQQLHVRRMHRPVNLIANVALSLGGREPCVALGLDARSDELACFPATYEATV
jgi:hypothetical protein